MPKELIQWRVLDDDDMPTDPPEYVHTDEGDPTKWYTRLAVGLVITMIFFAVVIIAASAAAP